MKSPSRSSGSPTRGVRIFYYLTDREVKRESAADKFMVHAIAFVDDMHREQARAANVRRAASARRWPGHVAGGRVYGYDNVRVDGHVERRINESRPPPSADLRATTPPGPDRAPSSRPLVAAGAPPPMPRRRRRGPRLDPGGDPRHPLPADSIAATSSGTSCGRPTVGGRTKVRVDRAPEADWTRRRGARRCGSSTRRPGPAVAGAPREAAARAEAVGTWTRASPRRPRSWPGWRAARPCGGALRGVAARTGPARDAPHPALRLRGTRAAGAPARTRVAPARGDGRPRGPRGARRRARRRDDRRGRRAGHRARPGGARRARGPTAGHRRAGPRAARRADGAAHGSRRGRGQGGDGPAREAGRRGGSGASPWPRTATLSTRRPARSTSRPRSPPRDPGASGRRPSEPARAPRRGARRPRAAFVPQARVRAVRRGPGPRLRFAGAGRLRAAARDTAPTRLVSPTGFEPVLPD